MSGNKQYGSNASPMSGNKQYGAYSTSQDPGGNYVINPANNPTGAPNGYGWMPAPGSGAQISHDYYGQNPMPNHSKPKP